jgi:hypothetical protein
MKHLVVVSLCGVMSMSVARATEGGGGQAAKQSGQPPKPAPGAQPPGITEMQAAMEKARRFTQPGANHKTLERFVGKWTTETRIFMAGKATPAEKGTAEFSWLMPGRWLKHESNGSIMGQPMKTFMMMGYDNFKQSFVSSQVSNLDTAMIYAEGDMDPGGKALLLYGTLDEYTTGEHDKMVRYIWRFPAADRLVLEVHDLPIGENNTKVIEVTYSRAS